MSTASRICRIDDCERESKGRGLCGTHWLRWRKYGDPSVVKKSGVDFNVATMCRADGCDRKSASRQLCDMHLRRFLKHGDTETLGAKGRPLKGDAPTFAAVHKRLERTRGRARHLTCVDCGGTAREWSYSGADPEQLTSPIGSAYSTDLSFYVPRCVSCHRTFDGAGNRARTALGKFAHKSAENVIELTRSVEVAA